MDYFSELLESYTKLKKRTFKLTYLNEQAKEEDEPEGAQSQEGRAASEEAANTAITNAPEMLPNEAEMKGGEVTRPDGQVSVTLKIYKNGDQNRKQSYGNVLVQGLPGKFPNKYKVVQAGPNADGRTKLSAPKNFEKFVKALGSDEEGVTSTDKTAIDTKNAEAEAAEAERQERVTKLFTIGGSFELMGRDSEEMKGTVENLNRSVEAVQKFCADYPHGTGTGALKNLCSSPGSYIGGGSTAGFEYKLAKGKTIQYDPETGKQMGSGEISPGLLQEVSESHASLTNFLTCDQNAGGGSPDSCNCAGMSYKVGMHRDKMIFFGSEATEGIAIKPNALQELSFKMMKDKCGTDDSAYTEIISEKLNGNSINAIKGTMNELIMQLGVRLVAAKTPEEREAAFIDIAAKIEDKRTDLRAYANQQQVEGDVALGFDEEFEQEVLLEQAGIADDPESLKNWFKAELSYQMAFIRLAAAEGVRPAGTEGGTGDRADTKLLYKDEQDLRDAAERLGVDVPKGKKLVKDKETGMFVLGVGQKRLKEIGKVKIGEINSIQRQRLIMDDEVPASDSDFHPGFPAKIREMQYGKNKDGSMDARQEAANNFYNDVENKIAETTAPLTETSTYTSDGKTKIQAPKGVVGGILGIVKSALSFDQLKGTALGRALFKDNGSPEDFSVAENQQRLSEVVQRDARFKMYSDAINGDDPVQAQAAKDALVRAMLISGANTDEMTQLITDDAGQSYNVPHNAPLQAICDANNNPEPPSGPLEVTIKGHSVTMTAPNGTSVTYSQERAWAGDQVMTRSQTKISREAIEEYNTLKEPENSSTLHKYLEGQMKLLEALINQAK